MSHVENTRQDPIGAQFLAQSLDAVAVEVGGDDAPRAPLQKSAHECPADTARRTRDDDDLPLRIHAGTIIEHRA